MANFLVGLRCSRANPAEGEKNVELKKLEFKYQDRALRKNYYVVLCHKSISKGGFHQTLNEEKSFHGQSGEETTFSLQRDN